ncbi:MAG: nuclear transport factor 2 family protein [Pseudomonadota bacterium]
MEERFAVHDVMHRYALAIDTKDWSLLESVFAPTIEADFRTFGAKDVFRGDAAAWVNTVRSTIDGMDATQHAMSNHLYNISRDIADGTTYIRALHVCRSGRGGERYTIGGHYEVSMEKSAEAWRITRYRLVVTHDEGDRHVLREAQRRHHAEGE